MKNEWQLKLNELLERRVPLEDVTNILKQFKNQNVKQDDILTYLKSQRKVAASEEIDDWVLEIMDIVVGFCNEKYKVW